VAAKCRSQQGLPNLLGKEPWENSEYEIGFGRGERLGILGLRRVVSKETSGGGYRR